MTDAEKIEKIKEILVHYLFIGGYSISMCVAEITKIVYEDT